MRASWAPTDTRNDTVIQSHGRPYFAAMAMALFVRVAERVRALEHHRRVEPRCRSSTCGSTRDTLCTARRTRAARECRTASALTCISAPFGRVLRVRVLVLPLPHGWSRLHDSVERRVGRSAGHFRCGRLTADRRLCTSTRPVHWHCACTTTRGDGLSAECGTFRDRSRGGSGRTARHRGSEPFARLRRWCRRTIFSSATALRAENPGAGAGLLNLKGNPGGVFSISLVPVMLQACGRNGARLSWAGVCASAALLWLTVDVRTRGDVVPFVA